MKNKHVFNIGDGMVLEECQLEQVQEIFYLLKERGFSMAPYDVSLSKENLFRSVSHSLVTSKYLVFHPLNNADKYLCWHFSVGHIVTNPLSYNQIKNLIVDEPFDPTKEIEVSSEGTTYISEINGSPIVHYVGLSKNGMCVVETQNGELFKRNLIRNTREKSAKQVFKEIYEEKTGKICDDVTLYHMQYCIDAIETYHKQFD